MTNAKIEELSAAFFRAKGSPKKLDSVCREAMNLAETLTAQLSAMKEKLDATEQEKSDAFGYARDMEAALKLQSDEHEKQLSAIREAGDEEVSAARDAIIQQRDSGRLWEPFRDSVDVLRDIAISRGQQLRERDAEIERLKNGNDFLRQEIEDWKETNRRAEAERDEARKQCETKP